MIILLFLIFLGLTILAMLADGEELAFIPLLGAFVCLIAAIVLCVGVKDGAVIDEKIAILIPYRDILTKRCVAGFSHHSIMHV